MKKKSVFTALMTAVLLSPVSLPAQTSSGAGDFIRTSRTQSFDTDFTQAAESTVNSVVCIKSYATRKQSYNPYGDMDPFGMFDFFFGPQQRQQPRQQQRKSEPVQTGLGSGVILSADGYIVTNNHVVEGADKLEVLLNDNTTYEALIVGTDEMTDLALLKVDAKNLHAITFGDSESLKVGEWVLAVGNPFGFNSTVTAGIVSAKARSFGQAGRQGALSIESFIQTDAALNPGNSGGALVNLKGELVGVNSAIYSNTGSYSGFSFAIPTTIVAKVMADLKQYGTVQRAVLGITIGELTPEIVKEKEIKGTKTGVIVASVGDRSTGKELGLETDDVIVAIEGVEITNMAQLHEQMAKFRPGDKVTVTYVRDGKRITRSATLRNSQGNTDITRKGDFAELGAAFMKVSAETKQHLGISYGVQVTGLKNGLLKNAGIKDGFIITEVNDNPVNSSDDLEYIYNSVMRDDAQDKVLFLTGVYPTGKKRYYAIDLSDE
ncbi:MAG: Do family serine endopeptidase [Muribaculaceae bacterium]|nr:Do family serine endopeptidase [Muribaculaceae bacterium]